ncbi:CRISPR-associated protein Cas4 [archaeon]|jgi:CRISPR-associated exonuclease Cas4|nr:CRISPR-associated protein Cas4 [archaeon]|tara:strand:- start:5076 stop:5918 length:843 start_codon:yes stop_codon:yes gene_type:complete
MKISVSMLSGYEYCPRKLYLQYVLCITEPPKESLVLGSLRHEIYDFINKNEEGIVTSITKKLQLSNILNIYKALYLKILREKIIKNKSKLSSVNLELASVFKRTYPLILNEAEARATNIFNFIQEYNIYGKELWENLTPKIISELRVESNILQLKGIIDKVEIHKDGYVPVELKTGKMPKEGIWPGHRIQIAAYALLLEEKYNKKIKEGFIHYLDAKELRHVAINPFMKEEITALTKEVQELLNRQYPPNYCQNKNKCTNCGLREDCYNEAQIDTLLSEI